MKLICYSLFDGEARRRWEKMFYIRGFYFNCRMNNLLFPDWRTHLEIDKVTYTFAQALFDWLVANNTLSLHVNETTPPLCEGMLWRMKPLFMHDVSHILCRDADSLTSYREASAVQEWVQSGLPVHAINDNSAHAGLMGGMLGFTTAVKSLTHWNVWADLIGDADLSAHGSDQNLLNAKLLPIAKTTVFLHCFDGAGCPSTRKAALTNIAPPQVRKELWESNLIIRHIGTAGFNEMEALRFLHRFDPEPAKYYPIEKEFERLFYWHL